MGFIIILLALILASFGCLTIAGSMLLLKDKNLNRVSTYFL